MCFEFCVWLVLRASVWVFLFAWCLLLGWILSFDFMVWLFVCVGLVLLVLLMLVRFAFDLLFVFVLIGLLLLASWCVLFGVLWFGFEFLGGWVWWILVVLVCVMVGFWFCVD